MVKLIGTGGNQVPTNNMLGNMAFQNKEGVSIDLLGLAAGTAAAPSLIPSGDPNTGVWFPAADTVSVSTGGTERLRVDSSGNVSIRLSANETRSISFFNTTNSGTYGRIRYTDSSGIFDIGNVAGYPVTLSTNDTERMRIDATGNVGIGTTSPTSRIHVYGTTSTTQQISIDGTSNTSSLKISYNGSQVGFLQNYQNTEINFGTSVSAPIMFYTNNTEKMRLTSAGNFGIGTASPLAKLDVAGFLRSGGDATFRGDIVIQQQANSAAGTGGLELKSDAGSAGYGARILTIFDGVSTYNLGFQTRSNSATWSTQMVVTSAGNVGIGTITPTQKLDVVGTGTFSVSVNTPFITFGGTTSAFPALKRSSTTLQVRLADDTADAPLSASTINATTIPVNTPAFATSGFSLTGNNAFSLMDLAGQWNTTGNPSAIRLNVTNIASGASSLLMELGTTDIGVYTARFTVSKAGSVTLADGGNLSVGLSTGTKIGTATSQKIGFWNVTPIIQPTTSVAAATFVANSGTAVNDASTFDGYTISKVVKALRNLGILA